jgi:hypothetical protein
MARAMAKDADLIQREFAAQIERYRARTLRTWVLLIIVSVCHVPKVALNSCQFDTAEGKTTIRSRISDTSEDRC